MVLLTPDRKADMQEKMNAIARIVQKVNVGNQFPHRSAYLVACTLCSCIKHGDAQFVLPLMDILGEYCSFKMNEKEMTTVGSSLTIILSTQLAFLYIITNTGYIPMATEEDYNQTKESFELRLRTYMEHVYGVPSPENESEEKVTTELDPGLRAQIEDILDGMNTG